MSRGVSAEARIKRAMRRIRFEPVRDWQELRHLRRAVESALSELPEGVRVALVITANELVENGLLHGDTAGEVEVGARTGEQRPPVTLELTHSSDAVELSVTTPLRSVDRAKIVLGLVEEVEGA